jgi:hypothetical protein
MSKTIKVTKETYTMEQLKKHLPDSCYEAVADSLKKSSSSVLDDSIYHEYFSSTPVPPLTESEQSELFEQLGNEWVKNHYSTETLRSLLDSEPSNKKGRKHG